MYDIYDADGKKQTEQWLKENYGNVYVTTEDSEGDDYFQVVAMYEGNEGESGFKATVLTIEGDPDQGRNVVFHWTGAPKHESGCATWPDNRFIAQATNHEGHTAFGMGSGAYYWPPQEEGPHKSWVCSSLKSDVVHNIGMLSGTNHKHMDVVWQRVENVSPPVIDPDPEPNPDDDTSCNDALIASYTEIILELIAKLA